MRITDAALAAAATLSDAYLPDRQLPDKAIDLIDEAAAKVRLGGWQLQHDKKERGSPKQQPHSGTTTEHW